MTSRADPHRSPVEQTGDLGDPREGLQHPRIGRLAVELTASATEWFFPGFVPRRMLSAVVGEPSAGKSTFGAFLCAIARRPVILPGFEEDAGGPLRSRLLSAEADLRHVLILDDRPYGVPWDRERITAAMVEHRADLLWIDPIDSYIGETNENDGQAVRHALETLAKMAKETGAAVVFARHPGKLPGNVCPGSRSWRAVPRVVLRMTVFPGPPEQRVLEAYKDNVGGVNPPTLYTLDTAEGWAPWFSLGGPLNPEDKVLLEVADRQDRRLVEQATEMLRAVLSEGRQQTTWLYAQAEAEQIGARTLRRAADRLGVVVEREGVGREHKAYWSLPGSEGVSE